jgi:hypothetical protein
MEMSVSLSGVHRTAREPACVYELTTHVNIKKGLHEMLGCKFPTLTWDDNSHG